jgi:hypothetical protein
VGQLYDDTWDYVQWDALGKFSTSVP